MKRAIVLMACVFVVGCNVAKPGPGEQAVVVRQPWFFGHGGVDGTPVTTGRSWLAMSSAVWYVPTTPISFTEHFEDLMSSEGVPLDFDSNLRFIITDSVKMVEKFGMNDVGNGSRPFPAWYANNVVAPYRNMVRQAVRKHGMNETAISTVAIEAIDAEVSDALRAYIKELGLPATLQDMTVGKANPPEAIKNQRIETAAQEQRGNTEKQRKLAEDQRKEAETARAAADNAYRNALGMSSEQFIQLEAIHAQRDVCLKGGCTFITGGASPLVNIR